MTNTLIDTCREGKRGGENITVKFRDIALLCLHYSVIMEEQASGTF